MNKSPQQLDEQLCYLRAPFYGAPLSRPGGNSGQRQLEPPGDFAQLIQGETMLRWDTHQAPDRLARFPVVKTLEQFQWNWPEKINQAQVKHLFQLDFIANKANAILLGGVGLGKTHLASAIGYEACLRGHSVLFATAVDVINTLSAAQTAGQLKNGLKKYLKPSLLLLDELGYLPIDKRGADLLFPSHQRSL